jgi:hypothetical protein
MIICWKLRNGIVVNEQTLDLLIYILNAIQRRIIES